MVGDHKVRAAVPWLSMELDHLCTFKMHTHGAVVVCYLSHYTQLVLLMGHGRLLFCARRGVDSEGVVVCALLSRQQGPAVFSKIQFIPSAHRNLSLSRKDGCRDIARVAFEGGGPAFNLGPWPF